MGGDTTILAGTSMLMEYQATTANRQEVYCQVVPIGPASELRMAFKRVMFAGDVTDVSDGLPVVPALSPEPPTTAGMPGPKTIFVTSTLHRDES